jgi:hypothetical protein
LGGTVEVLTVWVASDDSFAKYFGSGVIVRGAQYPCIAEVLLNAAIIADRHGIHPSPRPSPRRTGFIMPLCRMAGIRQSPLISIQNIELTCRLAMGSGADHA